MSKIEELIEKLCPNGVEYKSINDIFVQFSGMTGVSNKWKETGNCKFIDYMNAYKNIKIDVNRLENATVKKLEQNKLVKGDILLTSASETPDECAISSVIEGEIIDNVFMDDHLFGIRLKDEYKQCINTTFINYYMHTNNFRKAVFKAVRGVTRFYISVDTFMNINIAVPPLEVQDEIVHILDDFTLLSAELSAELKARQKQYDYYKQKVFDDIQTDNIKHITDIALVKARVGWQRLTKSEYLNSGDYYLITGTDFTTDGNINFDSCVYVSKDRYEMDKNIQVHKDDILITKDGTLGKVAILKEEPSKETTLNSGVFRIKVLDNKEVYPKYLYHFFTSKYFKDFVESVKTGSTIPHLTQQGLVTLDIPIPSLEEQIRLSDLLDNFDTLTNDITEGLPAEIEARQKQYEYYRDKLLTFKEIKVNEG